MIIQYFFFHLLYTPFLLFRWVAVESLIPNMYEYKFDPIDSFFKFIHTFFFIFYPLYSFRLLLQFIIYFFQTFTDNAIIMQFYELVRECRNLCTILLVLISRQQWSWQANGSTHQPSAGEEFVRLQVCGKWLISAYI